jgi:Flp pilus assembly protein TadG
MMNTRTPPTAAAERGSITLEVAVVAPALLLLVGLVVGAGRIALAEQAVQQAAAQAARDTSLARTPSAGVTAGRATAARVLAGQGLDCTSASTTVSAAALGYPPGQPGTVTVTTTCRVRLSDLVVPGFPGGRTLSAEASMPRDRYVAAR